MEERYNMAELVNALDELISDREKFVNLIEKDYEFDVEQFYKEWFEKFQKRSNCLSLYYLHMDDTEKRMKK